MAAIDICLLRSLPVRFFIATISLLLIGANANAQEKPAAEQPNAAVAGSDEESDDEPQPDPFAVPDSADADELLKFITDVKRRYGRSRKTVAQAATATVEAAQRIRNLDEVEFDSELRAIKEQIAGLQVLADQDSDRKDQLQSLLAELAGDDRPEIARIAKLETFNSLLRSAYQSDEVESPRLVNQYKDVFGAGEFDRTGYSMGVSLARVLQYRDDLEGAAELHEYIADRMEQSDNEILQTRAETVRGGAARLRLPGKFMEVSGELVGGEQLDWESYRGKVVLVDYWASWCGPCRAEIPNMKENLEIYGDRGFAIVGINLDRTLEDCTDYIESQSLPWENIVAEEGEDNPMVVRYGVMAIPTAILVDQEGKVVSLRARGKELNRLLTELLGPREKERPEESDQPAEEASEAEES